MARFDLPPYPCPVCDEPLHLRVIHSMPTDSEVVLSMALDDAAQEHIQQHVDELGEVV